MALTFKKARLEDIELAHRCETSNDDIDIDLEYSWWALPEPVLLNVYALLNTCDLLNASGTCKRWLAIADDNLLWKHKFQTHYQTVPNIALKPGAESWRSEYKRLAQHIPFVQTQRLEGHAHQVLHVSFAHNGEMFATCSKDGYVIIWNAQHPCTERYSHNMKQFSWKYTQYSQFNQSDTLLLVSGVHFGSPHSTSGEIAVFTVGGREQSHLRCRVVNRPYDIFGTWFSDQYLISGDLHWLAHLVSTSVLWLNKANQEIDSEHVPIMNQLYKFYNCNASSVRAIMVAKCPWLDESNDPLPIEATTALTATASKTAAGAATTPANATDEEKNAAAMSSAGNPLSHAATLRSQQRSASPENYLQDIMEQSTSRAAALKSSTAASSTFPSTSTRSTGYRSNKYSSSCSSSGECLDDTTIHYLDEYRREYKGDAMHESHYANTYSSDEENDEDGGGGGGGDGDADNDTPLEDAMDVTEEDDDMENSMPKYLIFSTGSKTYTPHQIGIKRARNVYFPKKLDPGPSLKERIAARRLAEQQNQQRADPDWGDYESVASRFDKADKVIDLHGHIIGMALSPDHRYLYVNTRPWPKNYVISNALEPPPIAQEIDIHVIDLMTLKRVGNMLHAHKAYTSSTECFFIFLDVCDDYVASGAEDHHAYLWDRYYGISLAKYKHTDVVNSVAFNPRDSEMLVTTSDDYTIKIWRSRAKAKAYNVQPANVTESFDLNKSTKCADHC